MIKRIYQTAARLGLLHCRTSVPMILLLSILAVCLMQRLILMVVFYDRLLLPADSQIVWAFLIGMRFDVVVAGMCVAPLLPVVSLAPPRVVAHRAFQFAAAGYVGLVLAVTCFLLVADALFFQEFSERLNDKIVHYLPTAGNEYILDVIWQRYPVVAVLLGMLAVGIAGGWLTWRVGFNRRYFAGPMWHALVWPALLAALVVLGIRGTVSSHAINTGPAYFSQSMSLNQLALNGIFTLRQAVIGNWFKRVEPSRMYPTIPTGDVDRIVRDLVLTEHDEPVANAFNPLHRVTHSGRARRDLNVVLVVLESLHWANIGHLGGREDLTPNLDELAANGVYAEHAYSVGGRTQRGFAGIFSGFPDLPRASVTTREAVAGRFLTLPGILKARGYRTLFLYGGPGHRDHRQTYLGSNGVDRFVTDDDLPVRTFRTKLGWNDRDLFDSTVQILSELPDDRPFFASLLTLTFHAPYTFPGSDRLPADLTIEQRELAAVRFTDESIGRFVEAARREPWFDRTVFVFVADHAGGPLENPKGPGIYRIPVIFYGPGIEGLEPRRIMGVRSQMDIAPTILGLLGGSYEHCFFGRDMLADGDVDHFGYVVTVSGELLFYSRADRVTVVQPDGGGAMAYSFDPRSRRVGAPSEPTPRDVNIAVALVQLAHRLFEGGHFNLTHDDSHTPLRGRVAASDSPPGDAGKAVATP